MESYGKRQKDNCLNLDLPDLPDAPYYLECSGIRKIGLGCGENIQVNQIHQVKIKV